MLGIYWSRLLSRYDKQRADEISKLSSQVATLSKKPYEEAHESLTLQKLTKLPVGAQEVLRFILHHPGIEVRQIPFPNAVPTTQECFNQGLLDRVQDRPGNGTVVFNNYFSVKESFRAVLKDVFYPRGS